MDIVNDFLNEPVDISPSRMFSRSLIYQALGDEENSVNSMIASIQMGYMPSDLATSELIESMKDDPRIQDVIKKYNLKIQ
jgi:hypothetical protein